MSAFCIRCKQESAVMVLGDWHPPWALCPSCAAEVAPVPPVEKGTAPDEEKNR